jgi:Iap family predicted aminopeptidase
LKEKEPREHLFEYLDSVLNVSKKKFEMENKLDADRQAWGRLIVNAVNSYGKLLETEELELRVEKLEEAIKDGLVIPSEKPK